MIEILSQKIKRNYILINAKPLTGFQIQPSQRLLPCQRLNFVNI